MRSHPLGPFQGARFPAGALLALYIAAIAWSCIGTPQAFAQGGSGAAGHTALPQLPKRPLRFDRLTPGQGLASPIVWDVLQDHRGFVWFATFDGLQRYDGYNLTTYLSRLDDSRSLSGNQLRVLFEDRSQVLWVGTWNNGLNRYDRQTDRFTRYRHDPADPASLSGNAIRAIVEDRAGNLWIATNGGLSRFDRATQRFVRFQHDPADPHSLGYNDIFSLYEDWAGALWIGTYGGGLDRFDPASGRFAHYRHNPADPASLSTDRVYTAITEDQAGGLWIGTWDGGLERLDRATGRFTHYRHDPADPASLAYNTVAALHVDAAGVLWAGTWGGGLDRFDPASGGFLHERSDPLDPSSLSDQRVVAITEDRSGMLWLGTEGGGVSLLDRYKQQFAHYRERPGDAASLAGSQVFGIAEDQTGDWWISTFGGGLNRLDRQSGQFAHYRHDPDDPASLSHDAVASVFVDRTGTLWAGTLQGLNRLDRETGRFVRYRHNDADPQSLSHDQVNTIYEDRAGALWLGTLDGLNRLDRRTGRFTRYRHDPNDPTSLSAFPIRTIIEDRRGNLWIGTRGGGLNRFDRQTGTFVRYQQKRADPRSLSSNAVLAIYEDQAGTLWLGTEDGGLNRFDPATGQVIASYRREDGLPSDSITSILADQQGKLWLGTSHGLARFDPATRQIRAYDESDGLPISLFQFGAAHRSRSGELIVGGINGFVAFDPSQLKEDAAAPPIALTDFQLANKPVPIGPDSPLVQAIDDQPVLTLSHEDRVISIEFAALSFRAPARNRYRYLLEGFDREWTVVDGTRRFVTYTNLHPGSYLFRVYGSNSHGVWNHAGRSLRIVITPPWWQTLWFRALAVLLLLGTGIGAYQWRVHALAARNRLLAAQVAERTGALAQRTDELAIANSQLQHQIAERTQAEEALQQVNHTLEQHVTELSALNQIVQALTMWTNLDPMLDMVGTMMTRLFDAATITIWQLHPAQAVLTRLSCAGQGTAASGRITLALRDEPLARRVLAEAQAVILTQRAPASLLGLPGAGAKPHPCLMVLPLQAGSAPIGLVAIRAAQPGTVYTPADVALAQTIAGTLANAIENARLSEAARATAVEEERKRLARELHDSISQELFAASITADVLPQLWELDPHDGQQALGDIKRLTHSALAEMRTLLVELRPSALARAPLNELLEYLVTAASAKSSAAIAARLDPAPPLPEEVQIALYRIAQEALNNTIKHAQAGRVDVVLQIAPPVAAGSEWHGELRLRVADDGRGFEPAHARRGRLGMESMHERAAMIGAALCLSSRPGEGTEVTVVWDSATEERSDGRLTDHPRHGGR
ncbi:MAG TPA: two-component regulator propeller domain-containing protein [Roseiflexaceae bacterium]|nr:two-component regulator propeller domain-containing protein [Roseiflexaceae bacterium]